MKTWAAMLAAALLVAGCSGSSDDQPAPAQTTSARDQADAQAAEQAEQLQQAQDDLAEKVDETAERAKGVVVTIDIAGGDVTPQGRRVEVAVGQKVYLDITSDVAEEIHVHSDPEHSYEVAPGDTVTKTFTIDTPGQVAVEAHDLGVTIVQLVVRP